MSKATEEKKTVTVTVSAAAKSELAAASTQLSQKDIYMQRIERLRGEGLVDVKFYPAKTFGVTEEAAYQELNRLHAAKDLPDKEVLGKYSLPS